ncbi:hypothetical protein [uncultured Pelagimonas sp.]|uniref:hypothetical protein n=1 Tax=uncultured Pelagimonas sp. TaxID=1618102 RepID=UPI0026093074|nr:hypothetical protein [uncultured Pelagimonas sp.]
MALKKLGGFLCALLLLFWNAPALSADSFKSTVVLLQNEKLDATARALIEVYFVHLTAQEKVVDSDRGTRPDSLHFASGLGFIKNQIVQDDALVGFDETARKDIQKWPTNSDSCYVQNVRTAQSERITIVVGNFPDDYPEDSLACLVAGLWWHKTGSLDGFDGFDWSGSFGRLLLR